MNLRLMGSLSFALVLGACASKGAPRETASESRTPSSAAAAPGAEDLFDILSPDEISAYIDDNKVETIQPEAGGPEVRPEVANEEVLSQLGAVAAPKMVDVVVYSKNHAKPDGPIKKEHVEVFYNGEKIHTWLTSTACNCVKTTSQGVSYRPRTPRGTFGFQRAVRYERSRSFHNALMNYALYVNHKPNSGIALHATYGENVAKLGTPGSAGCMRLSEDHARTLFDLVTKVGLKNAQVTIVDLQTKTGTLNVTP